MSNKIRVIIAEDVEIIRDNYVDILSCDSEIEVVGAVDSGNGAVELFEKCGADIVLMDVEMETQTAGIDAATKICENNHDVKIIFLSVHEDSETIIASLATGAIDYMIKTDNAEKIISHIKGAYQDKVEMELAIQRCMLDEFQRLSKTSTNIIAFTKKLSTLTPSEREIIALLLEGKKIKEIASIRFVEAVTIKTQVGQLLRKFGATRTKEIITQIKELKLDELFQTK